MRSILVQLVLGVIRLGLVGRRRALGLCWCMRAGEGRR